MREFPNGFESQLILDSLFQSSNILGYLLLLYLIEIVVGVEPIELFGIVIDRLTSLLVVLVMLVQDLLLSERNLALSNFRIRGQDFIGPLSFRWQLSCNCSHHVESPPYSL